MSVIQNVKLQYVSTVGTDIVVAISGLLLKDNQERKNFFFLREEKNIK